MTLSQASILWLLPKASGIFLPEKNPVLTGIQCIASHNTSYYTASTHFPNVFCKRAKENTLNAWLRTWVGTDSIINDENKFVGVLSSRKSEKSVSALLEFVYQRAFGTVFSMAYEATRLKEKLGKAREGVIIEGMPNGERMFCGHGSSCQLYAGKVSEFTVEVDKESRIETLKWKEPPVFKWEGKKIVSVPEKEFHFLSGPSEQTVSRD
jgi:hypothetical protein